MAEQLQHSRPIAWGSLAVAVGLVSAYPALFYLDRNAGLQTHGIPGISELDSLATAVAGVLVTRRQPRNAIGWMLVYIGLAGLVTSDAQLYSVLANRVHNGTIFGGAFVAWLGSWLFLPGIAVQLTMVLLLFPDGHPPSPKWRLVAWLSLSAVLVATVGLAIGAIPSSSNVVISADGVVSRRIMDTQALAVFPFLFGAVCVAGLVARFRRSEGQVRQQLKWFTYGGVLFAAGIVISLASVLGPDAHNQAPAWANVTQELSALAIPVSIAIAMLKYRLYDIDIVISRTLVYGALAAFITAVYVAIVVGIGALVGSGGRPNLALSIVATAIVAVAFQPLRERLRKIANRLVYGKRATPYEVLSQFSERVAETYAADEALPRMAQVLGQGTGAVSAEVWLRRGGALLRCTVV